LLLLSFGTHVSFADDALLCFADDRISEFDLDGDSMGVRDLCVQDGIAYLANRTDGLALVDVSDPEHPVLLSTFQTSSSAIDVTVHEGLAYVGTLGDGMFMVDVTDVHAPVLAGHYDEPFEVYATVVQGDFAYLACHENGVRVLDVSDPSAPIEIEHIPTEKFIIGLALEHDRLVAPFWGENIRLFDVSNPGSLVLLDTLEETGAYFDVSIEDQLVAVLNAGGIGDMYDLSGNTIEPYATVYPRLVGLLYDIEIRSGFVYIADTRGGVTVFDAREPDESVEIFSYLYDQEVYGLAISGDTLYVGGDDPSLSILDVSDLQSPVTQAITGFDRAPRFAEVPGVLYAADRSGVQVNRVHADGTLERLSEFDEPFDRGGIASIAADQGRLFIGNDTRFDIAEYDITDPENPLLVEVSRVGNSLPLNMVAHGSYLLAGSDTSLGVFDFSDPFHPVQVSEVPLPTSFNGALVEDDVLFVNLAFNALMMYDFSDPSMPALVADMSGMGLYYTSIDAVDGALYAATFEGDIDIYDYRDLSDIKLAGFADLLNGANQVRAWGEYLYVTDSSIKHSLFRLHDPFTPELVVSGGTGAFIDDIALIGEHAYLSVNTFGFQDKVEVIRVFGNQCPADLNADGALNFFDISAFLIGYQAQDPLADWNGDGLWDFFDVSGFLEEYLAGCP